MMKNISLTDILLIAVAIFATLQIRSCFSNVQKPEKMIRQEERIKYLEEKRLSDSVELVTIRGKYDSLIALSVQRFDQLANKFQQTKIIYEKIPVIVGDYTKQQLREGAERY